MLKKLIVFQMLNLSHPLVDLGYFLYVSTDKAFRDAHLTQVLDVYHDAFERHSDAKMPFTKEEFHKEFWRLASSYLFAGLGVRLFKFSKLIDLQYLSLGHGQCPQPQPT